MHIYTIFKIMQSPQNDILGFLTYDDWFKVRNLIIEMVLATDMTKHFAFLGNFRSKYQTLDLTLENEDDVKTMLIMAMKCSDLGHGAKVTE
mmetsp:Transcript_30075/g.5438  ORF Transcript_30075/g.5438 Transcript_30075/m.5438 type:complete len:91 (-) Transcript_30075:188-460(-)